MSAAIDVVRMAFTACTGIHHLDELRGLLLLRSYLGRDGDRHVTGNRMLTRSRGVIESVSSKVNAVVARYRRRVPHLKNCRGWIPMVLRVESR